MKVRVYFCREIDPQAILKGNKISEQVLNTIYELVWECEFKNILNVGRVWLKFREEERPFGIPVKEKRSHSKISAGDIIQISNEVVIILLNGRLAEIRYPTFQYNERKYPRTKREDRIF
jgi:hypothetical protein